MSFGLWISVVLCLVQPVSVLFIGLLAVHRGRALNFFERFGYLLMAVGLMAGAFSHFQLVFIEYREPRTLTWVPLYLGLNLLIWTRYAMVALPRWRQNIQSNFGKMEAEQ